MESAEALAAHGTQEMQFLQYFVPALFAQEYHPEDTETVKRSVR
jgi:hypothetical protein